MTEFQDKERLLVTGGCRSGKSDFAQKWAEARPGPRLYLATAQVLDREMAERVRRHQAARGPEWTTIEEPLQVEDIIEQNDNAGVILLDCLTLWLTNMLGRDVDDQRILTRVESLTDILARAACSSAVVTNELGWGVVPETPLGRRFRDLAGSANQILARAADRVILTVAGLPVTIKG